MAERDGEEGTRSKYIKNGSNGQQRRSLKNGYAKPTKRTSGKSRIIKYLGVTLLEGDLSIAVQAWITVAWAKWREPSPVSSDKRMNSKLKMNIYKTMV